MSRILFTAITLFATATAAQAAPLLHVSKASGFVAPPSSYQLECTVSSDYTVERVRLGTNPRMFTRVHPTRYTRAVRSELQIRGMLWIATTGRLMTTPGMTDMPTSSYYGLLGQRRVLLYLDQSIRRTRNLSPVVPSLLQLAELNCPTPRPQR